MGRASFKEAISSRIHQQIDAHSDCPLSSKVSMHGCHRHTLGLAQSTEVPRAVERPVDEIGTELLFENDVVRVWSMELAPGQVSPFHRHLLDYLIVYVTPSRITRMHQPDDAGVTEEFADGWVTYLNVGSGTQHLVRNDGPAAHRQVIVEFKQSTTPRATDGHNGRMIGRPHRNKSDK
jgi:beta-alanine degradation protein BauB